MFSATVITVVRRATAAGLLLLAVLAAPAVAQDTGTYSSAALDPGADVGRAWVDFNGDPHTCTVRGGSALFDEGPTGTFHAAAGTRIGPTTDP